MKAFGIALIVLGTLGFVSLVTAIMSARIVPPVSVPTHTETRLVCPHPAHDAYGPLGGGDLAARIDEHDARWDECIGEGGVPVPGYAHGARWGMVCLKPAGVINVHGTAW